MNPMQINPGPPPRPSIVVACGYDKTGKIDKIRCVPAIPGTVIERDGKHYVLLKNGSQRRLPDAR